MWEKDAAKYTKTTVALALAGLKKMAKILANTMSDKRYPELRISVCKGLQALVEHVLADIEENEDTEASTKLSWDHEALRKYVSRYLPILISFVEELDPEKDAERS